MKKAESFFLEFYITPEDFRRARLLFYFIAISILFALGYWITSFINGLSPVRINMALDIVIFSTLLLALRKNIGLDVIGQVFITACWITCAWLITISGGLYSPIMAWLPLVPVMALILLNKRSCIIWLIISCLPILFFTFTDQLNIRLPVYPITSKAIFITPILLGIPIILVWLTIIFDSQSITLMENLEKSNRQLKISELELKDNMEEMRAIQNSLTLREKDISTNKTRLEKFLSVAMDLVKTPEVQLGDQQMAIQIILKRSATAMNVSRASVWLYEKNPGLIRCLSLWQSDLDQYESGGVLYAKDYPSYFKYILGEGVVAATHASTDPSTTEFNTNYLKPLDIQSLLDAPFYVTGEFKGVVCFENQQGVKSWTSADQIFAKSIADIVGLTFITSELKIALEEIKLMNASLEQRVSERTEQLLKQNQQLKDYAYINAHQLRGPLSRIMGLVGLIDTDQLNEEDLKKSLVYLKESSNQLDEVVRKITAMLTETNSSESNSQLP